MKKGVIIYHSNIKNIYKDRWVTKCIESIINQTDNDFIFYEVDYGGDNYSVINKDCKIEKKYWSVKLINYADAMNFILDKAFEDGCDYVFNVNLDDYYHQNRISDQIEMVIKDNLDIVSSDFCYITELSINGEYTDNIIRFMNIYTEKIQKNLENRNNVIAHPAVCYTKKFWSDVRNRYDITKVPEEDLDLWIRAIRNGHKFGINNKILLYYRIHKNQVSNNEHISIY
jgi:hypothetical protein